MTYNGLHIVLSRLVHSWSYMNMLCYNDVQWPAISLCLAIGLSESQEQGKPIGGHAQKVNVLVEVPIASDIYKFIMSCSQKK